MRLVMSRCSFTVAVESLCSMLFLAFFQKFCPKKRKRLELKVVTYAEAELLVRSGWTIAPEEDTNRNYNMVYLERFE